jgi:hypothetical protein
MENQALTRLEALRRRNCMPCIAWDWRAGCCQSSPSGSGGGGWCPSSEGLAAYLINIFSKCRARDSPLTLTFKEFAANL